MRCNRLAWSGGWSVSESIEVVFVLFLGRLPAVLPLHLLPRLLHGLLALGLLLLRQLLATLHLRHYRRVVWCDLFGLVEVVHGLVQPALLDVRLSTTEMRLDRRVVELNRTGGAVDASSVVFELEVTCGHVLIREHLELLDHVDLTLGDLRTAQLVVLQQLGAEHVAVLLLAIETIDVEEDMVVLLERLLIIPRPEQLVALLLVPIRLVDQINLAVHRIYRGDVLECRLLLRRRVR
mmetsp:Transcript_2134/g.4835  ORF Transcript_2134/g.4835 Transcript_2134/m.4835 type:complete len:236 (-) Transcript_2134:139-846(-)